MSQQSIAHGSFALERHYPATVGRVYAARTDRVLKARWFVGPEGCAAVERTLDARIGGTEKLHGRFVGPSGTETLFVARHHDVIAAERLVYVYDTQLNGSYHSIALVTVELQPKGEGTQLVVTEPVAFLDITNADKGVTSRKAGTAAPFNRIARLFD